MREPPTVGGRCGVVGPGEQITAPVVDIQRFSYIEHISAPDSDAACWTFPISGRTSVENDVW